MKYGLSEKQLQDIATILAAWPDIDSVWLFGSRALGSYKEASDIDLAIKGHLNQKTLVRLKDAFEDSDLPFFVDLVEYAGITEPTLKKHIDGHGVCIYGADEGMSEWQKTSTGKLIDAGVLKIGDGYRAKNDELVANGFPFARAGNINNGFQFSGADCLPSHYAEIVGDKASKFGDTVFTSKGTVGRFGFVTEKTKKFIYSPQLCFWRSLKHDEIYPKFVYYWMHGNEFLGQVEGLKGQTDMADYVNLADQRRMSITLPSVSEQKAIATVLSSLDDKIDLLHRQNKTLEAMADTLFRQWFGDETSADWAEGTVEDLFILQRGYDLPTQDRIDGPYPIVTSSGISGGHAEYKVKAPGVTTGRSGLLGKVFLVQEDFWPLNTSLYVKEFKRGTPIFSYLFLKTMDLLALNAGSAVPTLNRNHVHAQTVPIPPRELIEQFENMVAPLFRKAVRNISHIRTLETLRDTLLPKLMSGEVRVEF